VSDPGVAIPDALEAAVAFDGPNASIDLDLFERLLKKAKVTVKRANKSALSAELANTREEIRIQKVRLAHDEDKGERQGRIAELSRREAEIEEVLWPRETAA